MCTSVNVFANVLCALALKWVSCGGIVCTWECEGEEESVSIKIYLQGEGL